MSLYDVVDAPVAFVLGGTEKAVGVGSVSEHGVRHAVFGFAAGSCNMGIDILRAVEQVVAIEDGLASMDHIHFLRALFWVKTVFRKEYSLR